MWKYLNKIGILLLIAFCGNVTAQTVPPVLKCAYVDANSQSGDDIVLTWENPANACAPYTIFASKTKAGPYTPIATIANGAQTSYTHTGSNGASTTWFYYMTSDAGCTGNAGQPSDTLDSVDPLPPKIRRVTVTGPNSVLIEWEKGVSPETYGYDIYWDQLGDGNFTPIGNMVGADNIQFTHLNSTPGERGEGYKLGSVDSCGNRGVFSNTAHRTIYSTYSVNRCEARINLNWSDYKGWSGGVREYRIWLQSQNGNDSLLGTVPFSRNVFTFKGLQNGQVYCFYVQAIANIDTTLTSESNLICDTLEIVQPPAFIYIHHLTVLSGNSIELEYFADTLSGITAFNIYRSVDGKDFTKVGLQLAPKNLKSSLTFTDNNVRTSDNQYIYKIEGLDSCNNKYESKTATTIFPWGEGNVDFTNLLYWNPYQNWLGGTNSYNIYRKDNNGNWILIGTTNGQTTQLADNIFNINSLDGIFCYKIEAVEGPNMLNQAYNLGNATSTSNEFCITQLPPFYVPTAFAPGGVNTIFKPVGMYYTLSDYKMQIYDRWGGLIFETTDPNGGWNGNKANGEPLPPGAYVYFIYFTNPDGKNYSATGNITLIR